MFYRVVSICVPILFSLLALTALLWWLGPKTIGDALLALSWQPVAAVGLVLFAGAALAGLRLRSIAHQMGHDLTFRETMQAMAFGQIGGTLSVQFFGQVAVRTALLRSRGLHLPENIALTSLEKLASFAVALGFALGGASWLFGEVALRLDAGGFRFLHLVVGSLGAAASGGLLGWGPVCWRAVRDRPASDLTSGLTRGLTWGLARPLLASMTYTVAIQLCTAAAYVVAAMALVPDINVGNLAAASFVIIFAASMPISLSGWGVRELSAVFVLKAIGVPPGTAVAIAVSVGTLSLLVIATIAALSLALPKRPIATAPAFRRVAKGSTLRLSRHGSSRLWSRR